jgi:hypothetical protein
MWNHRIVNSVDTFGSEQLELVEVFYDSKGEPYAYGVATIVSESVEDVAEQLEMFCTAMTKPILKYPEDFVGDVNI